MFCCTLRIFREIEFISLRPLSVFSTKEREKSQNKRVTASDISQMCHEYRQRFWTVYNKNTILQVFGCSLQLYYHWPTRVTSSPGRFLDRHTRFAQQFESLPRLGFMKLRFGLYPPIVCKLSGCTILMPRAFSRFSKYSQSNSMLCSRD